MLKNQKLPMWLGVVALGAVFALGTYVRLFQASTKSISHPEMYVPGIRMPEGLSEPRQRMTLMQVMTGTFSSDTHPPGYYVVMFGWTKLLGTSLLAIRLPSILMGLASIGLLAWIGNLIARKTAGWVAAALLAVNGFHVFWSQIARMYSMVCFLGLVSTVLLIPLVKKSGPKRSVAAGYVLVSLLGLATHVFFWPLLLTQMLWTFLNALQKDQQMPAICRLQLLILILGSPLLASAAYQSGNDVATLSGDFVFFSNQFLQFSFLFPVPGFETFLTSPSSLPRFPEALMLLAQFVALSISIVLLAAAIRIRRPGDETWVQSPTGPQARTWFGAALLATAIIVAFVVGARIFVKPHPSPTLKIAQVMIVVPFLFLVAAFLLARHWSKMSGWVQSVVRSCTIADGGFLVALQALLPIFLLSVLSLWRPLLNPRGLMVFTPYLLFLLASGFVALARRHVLIAGALVVLLGVLHGTSLIAYLPRTASPVDYGLFARELAPQTRPTDIILLQKNWGVTPILYYLPADRYRLSELGSLTKVASDPANDRLWVLLFRGALTDRQLQEAPDGYRLAQSVRVENARGLLYERKK